jgi:ankyrin repeat protein
MAAAPSMEDQHAFLEAAKTFAWDKVMETIDTYPAIVNCQPCRRWTALHQASFRGNATMVTQLLAKRANVWATASSTNVRPIDVIGQNENCTSQEKEMVQQLLQQAMTPTQQESQSTTASTSSTSGWWVIPPYPENTSE